MDRSRHEIDQAGLAGRRFAWCPPWGALDQLLDDERVHIVAISGTSAGAMNAVAVAEGMAAGGPAEARERLGSFWSALGTAALFSPVQRSPIDMLMGNLESRQIFRHPSSALDCVMASMSRHRPSCR